MKLNLNSFVRAALQIGGTLVTSGVVTGHSADVLTHVVGIGAMLTGIVWGQTNALMQDANARIVNGG